MSFQRMTGPGVDYCLCRYGKSGPMFRGPRPDLGQPFIAVAGGSETFGKFLERPYPTILGGVAGMPVANLGCMNGGIEMYRADRGLRRICNAASVLVVQIVGAQNVSNRFYRVHPRRNDRFLVALEPLRAAFGQIDLTDVHFTGHLLARLAEAGADRMPAVIEALQAAWAEQMQALLRERKGPTVLLWLSDTPPPETAEPGSRVHEPLFVTRQMLDALRPKVAALVEVSVSREEILAGQQRMLSSPLEDPIAHHMLGAVAHDAAALRLAAVLADLGIGEGGP